MSGESKRPPGRPTGGRVFERADLVDAALEAIARGGYETLSMRGVARDVGCSLATVQRHFSTKDDLWKAAIDDFLDSFGTPWDSVENDETPLVTLIDQLLRRGSERPGLVAALINDRSPGHEDRWSHLGGRLKERHDRGREMFEELQELGRIRAIDLRALQFLMNIGMVSLGGAAGPARVVHGFNLEDPDERRRVAAALADIIGFGIAPR